MEAIAPRANTFVLPEKYELPVYAADQPQYNPLPAIRLEDGRVVTQWKPDPDELKLLLLGQPITLIQHTFNMYRCPYCHVGTPTRLQPVALGVGGFDLT